MAASGSARTTAASSIGGPAAEIPDRGPRSQGLEGHWTVATGLPSDTRLDDRGRPETADAAAARNGRAGSSSSTERGSADSGDATGATTRRSRFSTPTRIRLAPSGRPVRPGAPTNCATTASRSATTPATASRSAGSAPSTAIAPDAFSPGATRGSSSSTATAGGRSVCRRRTPAASVPSPRSPTAPSGSPALPQASCVGPEAPHPSRRARGFPPELDLQPGGRPRAQPLALRRGGGAAPAARGLRALDAGRARLGPGGASLGAGRPPRPRVQRLGSSRRGQPAGRPDGLPNGDRRRAGRSGACPAVAPRPGRALRRPRRDGRAGARSRDPASPRPDGTGSARPLRRA